MTTSCTYRHVMLARAENRKGNVHVVSKMYMYNRTIFMQKYIVLFDGRSIKHIQVHCLSPRFLNFATSTCTCIWNILYEWVRNNLITVNSFIFVGCFLCILKKIIFTLFLGSLIACKKRIVPYVFYFSYEKYH